MAVQIFRLRELAKRFNLAAGPELPVLLVWVAAFAALCSYYLPFLSDDALISLRYSQRLAEGRGLTWTDGERVEGYTNLLWVLLHAPFAFVGLDLVQVTRWLGCVAALLGLYAMALSPMTLRPRLGRVIGGSGFLALLVPYAVWAIGGLEHGFMAALICISLLLSERHYRLLIENENARGEPRCLSLCLSLPALSACLAALTWTRADGILVAGMICAGVTLAGLPQFSGLRLALKMSVGPVAAFALQMAFRLLYYQDWVPNTARAKVSTEHSRWEEGVIHVANGVSATSVGIAVVVLALTLGGKRVFQRALPALCVSVGWLSYQAYIGGDIFPSFRQVLLGLAPLAHVLAVSATDWKPQKARCNLLLGVAALASLHVHQQMQHPENQRGKTERWEWGGASVGPLLGKAFGAEQPLLGVDAAGALPFWSGLPSLDLLGLNDSYLAAHRPKDFGRGGIGHELGDAQYYLDRNADLFAFCNSVGSEIPCFPHSTEMVRRREFRDAYRLLRLEGLPPQRTHGAIFVRLDGKIGIERTPDEWRFPSNFFASSKGSLRATLGADGKLGVTLLPGHIAVVGDIKLPSGRWRIKLAGNSPNVEVGVWCDDKDAQRLTAEPIIEVRRTRNIDVVVALEQGHGELRLGQLVLTRVDDEPGLRCFRSSQPTHTNLLGKPLEGAEWRAPPALRIPQSGLSLLITRPPHTSHLVLSADGNDALRVKVVKKSALSADEESSSPWIKIPRVSGNGMRVRRLELPAGTPFGVDLELQVFQSGGDGRASVRSATFE